MRKPTAVISLHVMITDITLSWAGAGEGGWCGGRGIPYPPSPLILRGAIRIIFPFLWIKSQFVGHRYAAEVYGSVLSFDVALPWLM